MSLQDALERVMALIQPVSGLENVALDQAWHRVLADDLVSTLDSPPFRNSAMDGYALNSLDTSDGGNAVTLEVVGTSWAGKPYDGTVARGQCVRIFTGAAMPAETDAVVMQEEVERTDNRIILRQPVPPAAFVRSAGRDIACGQIALRKGKRLTAIDIGLIATLGIRELATRRRIRASLFSTGDELRPPGTPLRYGEIYDSNRHAIKAFLLQLGVQAHDLGAIPDDPAQQKAVIGEASCWSDVIISIGGASVGDADHLVPLVRELGQLELWKVALKPGKPIAFGQIGSTYLFGLPGNPVSAIVTFLQIVRPALLRLMGAEPEPVLRVPARAAERIVKSAGRLEFQRGVYSTQTDGSLSVVALAGQDADRQATLNAANCFIVLPADGCGAEAGATVTIEPFTNYL